MLSPVCLSALGFLLKQKHITSYASGFKSQPVRYFSFRKISNLSNLFDVRICDGGT